MLEDIDMITGKNKEQFDKFRFNNDLRVLIRGIDMFIHQPFEMQIGVYLAYYDSLDGVKYIADYDVNEEKWFIWMVSKDRVRMIRDDNGKAMWFGTRKEAEIELLKKSNELRNEQLNK